MKTKPARLAKIPVEIFHWVAQQMNQERNRTVSNTQLMMRFASNLSTKNGGSGLALFMKYVTKVNSAELASPALVIRPLLWDVLSCSLHMKALEFVTFVVRDLIELTQGF